MDVYDVGSNVGPFDATDAAQSEHVERRSMRGSSSVHEIF